MTSEFQQYAERFLIAVERIATALEDRQSEPQHTYHGPQRESGHGERISRPKQASRS